MAVVPRLWGGAAVEMCSREDLYFRLSVDAPDQISQDPLNVVSSFKCFKRPRIFHVCRIATCQSLRPRQYDATFLRVGGHCSRILNLESVHRGCILQTISNIFQYMFCFDRSKKKHASLKSLIRVQRHSPGAQSHRLHLHPARGGGANKLFSIAQKQQQISTRNL